MMYLLYETGFCFLLLRVDQMHGPAHGTIEAILCPVVIKVVIKIGGAKRIVHPFL
jgi:hypothetical protein